MILVDTDILIDILWRYKPALDWLETLDEIIAITYFTAMELIQGCENKSEIRQTIKFINQFKVLWLSEENAEYAVKIFAENRLKNNFGMIDVFIAQIAIESNLVLNTFNIKHYQIIPSLKTNQPYLKNL